MDDQNMINGYGARTVSTDAASVKLDVHWVYVTAPWAKSLRGTNDYDSRRDHAFSVAAPPATGDGGR